LKPYKSRGYAKVKLPSEGRFHAFRVHRLVLATFVGPCPDGYVACHNDGDPANNRLGNLRWGSHRSNSEDRRRHGTLRRGEDLPQAKLRATEVLEIRRLRNEGLRYSDLARQFGVSDDTIYAIVKGRSWKHLLPHEEIQRWDTDAVEHRGAA
jgi:hypothetical protein